VTASSREDATEQELAVGHEELDVAVKDRKTLDLRALRPEELVGAALYVTEIPEGAMVIDTRPARAFEAWHLPGSTRRDLDDVEATFSELDRSRTYVLLCAEGLRTAYVAEVMQRAGYEAYSFLGGAPRLRREVGAPQL
jgi:thiamine biosynthesis protein ThiI